MAYILPRIAALNADVARMHLLRRFPSLPIQACRGAARRGIRLRKLMLRKQAMKNMPPQKKEEKRITFLERMKARNATKGLSFLVQHPPRVIEPLELPEQPEDDVWLIEDYKERIYTVSEALEMHREAMHPTVFNRMDAPVRLRLELNMNLEKKTKFVEPRKEMLALPYPFEQERRNVLVFTKDEKQIKASLDMGAEAAGGEDLVKKILKGEVSCDFIDYAVCHLDMHEAIVPLRGILKKRFPTTENMGVGIDVPVLAKLFIYGVEYEIQRDYNKPQYGLCDTVIAKLDMPDEQIEANIATVIKIVCKIRPITPKLGHVIHRALLMLGEKLSSEYFALPFWNYVPMPDDAPVKESTTGTSKAKTKVKM